MKNKEEFLSVLKELKDNITDMRLKRRVITENDYIKYINKLEKGVNKLEELICQEKKL